MVRQADALTKAGYSVTVYCLGMPHEELLAAAPEARFFAIDEAEMARVKARDVRAMRDELGLHALPYVPWSALRLLFSLKKSRLTALVGHGARSALAGARRLKARRQTPSDPASGPVSGRQSVAPLPGIAPMDLPRLQLSLASRLHEHARFAAAVARRISAAAQENGAVDIVQAHDVHSLFAGTLIGRRLGAPVIYDAVEIPGHQIKADERPAWTDTADAILCQASRQMIGQADQVITVGESLAQWYDANFSLRAPVRPIRNARFYVLSDTDMRVRQDCGIGPEVPLLFWCGSASPQRGLEFIVELLAQMPNVHAALVTEFPPFWEDFRRSFLAQVKHLEVGDRLHILPLRSPQDLISYASGADIGIITAPKNAPLNVRLSLPNKFFEMVMARLPIAVGDLDNIRLLVERYGIGCDVDVSDVSNAARGVAALIKRRRDDPVLAERLEDAARVLSWEEEAKTLVALYSELLERPRSRHVGPS